MRSWSNPGRKQKENEIREKEVCFPLVGDPRMPKRVVCWKGQKRRNLKFQMRITGVPFGRTEVLVAPLQPQERDLAAILLGGKVPRGLGRWEKVEKCSIVLTYCLSCLEK